MRYRRCAQAVDERVDRRRTVVARVRPVEPPALDQGDGSARARTHRTAADGGRVAQGSDTDFGRIWHGTLSALGDAGLSAQQHAFLRLAKLVGLLDSTALLAVPNELTKDVLEQRMRAQVTDALGAQLDREIRIAVTVDPALAMEPDPVDVVDVTDTVDVTDPVTARA